MLLIYLLRILNVYYIKNKSPIDKTGPVLSVNYECIKGVKKLGVGIFNISNNHIMDNDPTGVNHTIHLLNDNGIYYYGVGSTLHEARIPLIINKKMSE